MCRSVSKVVCSILLCVYLVCCFVCCCCLSKAMWYVYISFFLSSLVGLFTRVEDDAHNLHFQDTRFRARISNTRSDHFWQLQNKSFHSKDTRFRAHIVDTRGDHFWQHTHKYIHAKDTRFRANISNTRGGHYRQLDDKYLYPKDIRFRARISNTRGDLFFGSFRTNILTIPFIPRTSVIPRVF